MGPGVGQTLNANDSIRVIYNDNTYIDLMPLTDTVDNKLHPLTVFSNYQCQLAHYKYIPNKTLTDITPFILKLADIQTPVDSANKHINLNNYTDGISNYTKISTKDFTPATNKPLFTLNINIDTGNYGLIMFYYMDDNYGKTEYTKATNVTADNFNELKENLFIKNVDNSYSKVAEGASFSTETTYYEFIEYKPASIVAKAAGDSGLEAKAIGRFNTDDELVSKYYFKVDPKIQIIKLDPDVKQLEIYPDTLYDATIIFSGLSIVEGINPLLDYRSSEGTQSDAGLTELLAEIKKLDTNNTFYYNMPIDNNRAIDLNHLVGEKLSSPVAWYDSNNENNKFVISEIDADSLETGITLTKASRY
jgi:hypothetical protein